MAYFERVTALSAGRLLKLADVDRIAQVIRGGGLAILPTETGYMLAALATREDFVLKAFEVKMRDPKNVMHVACSSLDMARLYSEITPLAARLLGEFTPGPLTVVVEQTRRLPGRLVTLNGTVGIRIPDHPATLQVVAAVGEPVTATSLNEAGQPAHSLDQPDLERLNWPRTEVVVVVEDQAAVAYEQPSTLLRVTGAKPELLRAGPISEDAIAKVLAA